MTDSPRPDRRSPVAEPPLVRDAVPREMRRAWVAQGWCPDVPLYEAFRRQAGRRPQAPAVRDVHGTVTFAELDAQARVLAGQLRAHGVRPGDIVGIRLPDSRAAFAADLAVAAAGAVALPWPAGTGAPVTRQILERAGARTVLAGPGDLPPGALPDGVQVLDPDAPEPACCVPDFRPVAVDPDGPARILVSSGTEAAPKLVAYSHNALLGGRGTYVAGVLSAPGVPAPAGARSADAARLRPLVLVPLASSFGSLGIVALVRCGACVQVPGRFEPARALRALSRWRATHAVAVPTMVRRMAALAPDPAEDLAALRAVVCSGAALPAAVRDTALERFGRPVVNVYGSSDGVNCWTVWTEPGGDVRRAGRPDPRVTAIRVCGPGDRPLPAGTPGEIQARGPMSPLGYVGAPESDARYRTADGWVRTGDRGEIGADGVLRVHDRIKHVVIRGGWTISPAYVEEQVHAHPGVAEAVCVPVPDDDLGERICVCVVQHAGSEPIDTAGLRDWLTRERGLERRQLPDHVLRVEGFPLGPTGKVCRRTLAAAAAARFGPPGARPGT